MESRLKLLTENWLDTWSNDVSLNVKHVAIWILMEDDACGWVNNEFVLLFGQNVYYAWVELDLLIWFNEFGALPFCF